MATAISQKAASGFQAAQAAKLMAMPLIISIQTVGWFWAAWAEVYRESRK